MNVTELYIEQALQLIVSVFGIVIWKKCPFVLKLFIVNIIAGALFTRISVIYGHYHHNNLALYNVYDLFDAIYMAYAIYQFEKSAIQAKVLVVGLLIFCAIHVTCIYLEGFHVLATWSLIYRYVLFSSICLAVVINTSRKKSNASILYDPLFWLCMSQLMYNCASIPVFSFINYMIKYRYELAVKTYKINFILSWIQLLLVFLSLYLQMLQSKRAEKIQKV